MPSRVDYSKSVYSFQNIDRLSHSAIMNSSYVVEPKAMCKEFSKQSENSAMPSNLIIKEPNTMSSIITTPDVISNIDLNINGKYQFFEKTRHNKF
jgi:hypothetical protein